MPGNDEKHRRLAVKSQVISGVIVQYSQTTEQNKEKTSRLSIENTAGGHRTRLLERFARSGLSAFHDHEIIELLLTYAIPRKDTKKIAKDLLQQYKTVGTIINTPPDQLMEVDGIGERSALLISLLKEIMALCLREKYEKQSAIAHRRDVEEYLRFHFGHRRDEYVAALYLDNANHVLETTILATGTVNQCTVYPRNVVERALRCGAASVIIAHNHPGGGLKPSDADWLITKRLCAIGKLLEIPLLDHILITKEDVMSLRALPQWPK
jgi:DNA repair protein RadC